MAKEKQKVREGRVVSDKMAKTVVVAVPWVQTHPLYRQRIRRITKLYAHDIDNQCRVGDWVRIRETRPISRLKRWRVVEVLERHEVVEIKPAELEQEELAEVIAPAAESSSLKTSPEMATLEAQTSSSEDIDVQGSAEIPDPEASEEESNK